MREHTSRAVWVRAVDALDYVLGPLLMTLGLSLATFLACCFFFAILPRHDASFSTTLANLAGVYVFLQLYINYILCITTNPGRVVPSEADKRAFPTCRHCDAGQPPRSHHCHSCRSCVLEMDHHCVWVNNCIGYFNYRFFWRFLLFTWLACAMVAAGAAAPSRAAPPDDWSSKCFVSFPFVLCLCIGLVVFGLWLWHVYLVLTGQTSIDAIVRYRMKLKPKNVTWPCMQSNVSRLLGHPWWRAILVPSLAVRDHHESSASVTSMV
ncbi:Aste57867_19819 [Aphanomyces stellatus]|uniref:Palmitoyltransferase n=1 Tax=Aphanomyces stellatus TaxID=120398 RepID=A0A485LE59_9STRA|nr:hypothetical protein As57867_019754 [Aphanomyces stellatus]VFT96517.1 Aste57867_19819 [Aphanomyces stellatus]